MQITCAFCERPFGRDSDDEYSFTDHIDLYPGCQAEFRNYKPAGYRFVNVQLERLSPKNSTPRHLHFRTDPSLKHDDLVVLGHGCCGNLRRLISDLFASRVYPPTDRDNDLFRIDFTDLFSLREWLLDLVKECDTTTKEKVAAKQSGAQTSRVARDQEPEFQHKGMTKKQWLDQATALSTQHARAGLQDEHTKSRDVFPIRDHVYRWSVDSFGVWSHCWYVL